MTKELPSNRPIVTYITIDQIIKLCCPKGNRKCLYGQGHEVWESDVDAACCFALQQLLLICSSYKNSFINVLIPRQQAAGTWRGFEAHAVLALRPLASLGMFCLIAEQLSLAYQ